MKLFGERLKALREEKNVKQKDIADLLGCTVRHYQAIEAGEINIPCLKLQKLADYFDVSMDFMMGRTDCREIYRK